MIAIEYHHFLENKYATNIKTKIKNNLTSFSITFEQQHNFIAKFVVTLKQLLFFQYFSKFS